MHRDGDEPLLGSGSLAIVDNLTLLYSHRYLHEVAHAAADRAAVQNDSSRWRSWSCAACRA